MDIAPTRDQAHKVSACEGKGITMMSMCRKSCPQNKIQEIKNGGIVVIKDGEDGVLPLHCCVLECTSKTLA